MLLGILTWVIVGLVVGFVASRVVTLRGDDPRIGIGVSVAAAFIGGWLYSWISGRAVGLTSMWSWMYAAFAAIVAITVWHIVRHRGTYDQPTFRRSY